jgi:hypothetical protein
VLPYAHALALEAALPKAGLLTLEGTGHELHRADWPAILDAVERNTGEGDGRAGDELGSILLRDLRPEQGNLWTFGTYRGAS